MDSLVISFPAGTALSTRRGAACNRGAVLAPGPAPCHPWRLGRFTGSLCGSALP